MASGPMDLSDKRASLQTKQFCNFPALPVTAAEKKPQPISGNELQRLCVTWVEKEA